MSHELHLEKRSRIAGETKTQEPLNTFIIQLMHNIEYVDTIKVIKYL